MSSNQPDELMSVISEVFDAEEVSLESTFNSLDATSVTLLRLIVVLKSRFDVDLDVVDMFTVDTVNDLVLLVEERAPQNGHLST